MRWTAAIAAAAFTGAAAGGLVLLFLGGAEDGMPPTADGEPRTPPPIVPAEAPVGPCTEDLATALPLERLGGATPAGSAACAAFRSFTTGVEHAVLATGTTAALLAAPLATQDEAPVLLLGNDDLPGETVTALRDLGVEEVTIVGDPSERLIASVREVTAVGDVISGQDAPDLAVEVAGRIGADERLYVTAGAGPELLVAATEAARDRAPLLLLDGPASAAVVDLAAQAGEVRVVGHPSVVPDASVAPLREVTRVVRLDGADSAGTAVGAARLRNGLDGPLLAVDQGAVAHAVAAPWAAATADAPLILVGDTLPGETRRWLLLGGLHPGRRVDLMAPTTQEAVVGALEDLAVEVADGPPAPQVRGAWAHLFDESLKTREGITAFLDRAAETRLNTVIVQVARRQDAYYASDVLPRATDPELEPDLDLLAELVPRAQARGLEVHAWFAVAQAWHMVYTDLRAPAGWVWAQHGPASDDPWVTRPHPDRADALGYPDAFRTYPYLDLAVPAVRDHIVATLVEVADRYPVDAIHLDYLRYPGKEWGYHPIALRRFAEETGRSVDRPPAPDDRVWSDWRRRQVTDLAARIDAELDAVRSDLTISAAVIAQGDGPTRSRPFSSTIAYDDKLQDWVSWARSGLVDLTIPMAYFDERQYATRYDQWLGLARGLAEGAGQVAIGQASWLNPSTLSLTQAEEALRDSDGLVLYSYQQDTWCPAGTTETGDPCEPVEPPTTLWRRLAEGPFAEPAPPR